MTAQSDYLINGYTLREYLNNYMRMFGDNYPGGLVQVASNGWYDAELGEWIHPELYDHMVHVVATGGELNGDGNACDVVLSIVFTPTMQPIAYMQMTGWYDSYNGHEWNPGYTPVFPRAVTIIKYFKEGE